MVFDVSGWGRAVAKTRESSLQGCLFGCRAEARAEFCGAGDSGNVGRAVAGGGGALRASPPGVAQEPLQHGFVTALPVGVSSHNAIPQAVFQTRLGRVDIHRSQIMAPTRNSMDANESAVFS